MLAAALVIGFGLWITNLYFQKSPGIPTTTVQSISPKTAPSEVEKNILPGKKGDNAVVQSTKENSEPVVPEVKDKEKNKKSPREKNNNNSAVLHAGNKIQKQEPENLIKQVPETIKNEVTDSNVKIKNIPNDKLTPLDKIDPVKELAQNIPEEKEDKLQPGIHALNASYVQEGNDNNQNYVFYDITTDEFKRTKVGGFLKKVKRVIERNNPITRILSGDDRQVVSN